MPLNRLLRRAAFLASSIVATALWAGTAAAQVHQVTVGITPTCPYGLGACWAGAYEALGQLEGVKTVATVPDTYNCTADLSRTGEGLPDVARWAEQFKSKVGQAYGFRGVEVTLVGSISRKGDQLVLQCPGINQPIPLAPLRHKLQWNFSKGDARQPEPDEQAAHDQLAAKTKEATPETLKVQVTGPLVKTDAGVGLEVREFFLLMPGADPKNRY